MSATRRKSRDLTFVRLERLDVLDRQIRSRLFGAMHRNDCDILHPIGGAARPIYNRHPDPTQYLENVSKHEFTRILSVGTRSEPQKTRPLGQRARRCTPNGSRVVRFPTTDGSARPPGIGCSAGTAKAASLGRLHRFADPSRTHPVRPMSSFSRRASFRRGRRPEPFNGRARARIALPS